MLVFSVCAAFAVPASAQAATITVDQECIEAPGGLVSGTFTGTPAGESAVFVSIHPDPGNDVVPSYGGDFADLDAFGNGTFSFNVVTVLSSYPDTLYVKARFHDSTAPG